MTDKLIQLATGQFKLDINGHHGIPHWQRVESNGFALAIHTGADVDVVQHFAWLHDACREDEWDDPEHGCRAADWCQGLWSAGLLDLTSNKLDLLKHACRLHTEGKIMGDITVQTCWDADRLDIGRVGITPAARFLCTPAAKDMLASMQAKA